MNDSQMEMEGTPAPMGDGGNTLMKAIVQDRYGRPDVLQLRDVDRPVPSDDEVLIRVVASSLNIYDWHMVTGTPYLVHMVAGMLKPKHPIPGADVAGIVEGVGKNVTRFQAGDEVYGDIGFGAFAEYATAREGKISAKPARASFEQAAATPLAGLTALQGLRDVGGLISGQRVLINGASGGVGTFAVQIAKALGAEVTAVCSTTKVETVRSIGADKVIDYTTDDYTMSERDYDLLFDNVGDRSWSQTSRVLVPNGKIVAITGKKHAVMGPFRHLVARKVAAAFSSKKLAWFTAQIKADDLEFMAGLLESGKVVPVIERTYPLAELPDALRYLGEGHALGKLVITM